MCCENFHLSSGVLGVGLDADFSCRGVLESPSVRSSPHPTLYFPAVRLAPYHLIFDYWDLAKGASFWKLHSPEASNHRPGKRAPNFPEASIPEAEKRCARSPAWLRRIPPG